MNKRQKDSIKKDLELIKSDPIGAIFVVVGPILAFLAGLFGWL